MKSILSLVSFFLILSTLSQASSKKKSLSKLPTCEFCKFKFISYRCQFTVTNGTLKKPDYSIAYLQQEVEALKSQNTSATVVLKNDVVSSFKHAFIKDTHRLSVLQLQV
jgi:hypothetical protein